MTSRHAVWPASSWTEIKPRWFIYRMLSSRDSCTIATSKYYYSLLAMVRSRRSCAPSAVEFLESISRHKKSSGTVWTATLSAVGWNVASRAALNNVQLAPRFFAWSLSVCIRNCSSQSVQLWKDSVVNLYRPLWKVARGLVDCVRRALLCRVVARAAGWNSSLSSRQDCGELQGSLEYYIVAVSIQDNCFILS